MILDFFASLTVLSQDGHQPEFQVHLRRGLLLSGVFAVAAKQIDKFEIR